MSRCGVEGALEMMKKMEGGGADVTSLLHPSQSRSASSSFSCCEYTHLSSKEIKDRIASRHT
jgi:hypothetical protein